LKYKRKAFKASMALGITGNFKNLHKPEDVDKREFGLSSQYRKAWFDELYKKTGIRLENVTYYRDETHYFVATANKANLLDYGVLLKHYTDTNELLHPSNVNKSKLEEFTREFAEFCNIPKNREFATNQRGKPDVAIFDFTTKWYNTYSTKIFETKNGKNRLLTGMVGDSLLGPFWPQV
jgi:F-actin monooxygenase